MKNYKITISIIICCLLTVTTIQAQSLKDLLNRVPPQNETNETSGSANTNFVGTWDYTGSAVAFKTDDLLKKAGGAAAASSIKKSLDEQLTQMGVQSGTAQFTFNKDGIFSAVMNKKAMRGVYAYNATTNIVSLTIASYINISARVVKKSSGMSLLFDADKLLLMLTFLGEQANSPSVKAMAQLASGYDGLLLGFEVKRK